MTVDDQLANIYYGVALRLARERLGKDQIESAYNLGMAQSTYSRFEGGQRTVSKRESDIVNALFGVDVWAASEVLARQVGVAVSAWGLTPAEAYDQAGREAMVGLVLFVARSRARDDR